MLLSNAKEKNYEETEKYAEIIQQSSQRAFTLLNNLMEWAQSQIGRMVFNPEYFDINTIVNEVILLNDGSAKQKSISLTNKMLSDIQVYADKAMISSVVRNLISNAIKFTHINGKITIKSVVNQNDLTISVIDTGVGISKDRIDKLFTINEGISTKGTQSENGTGLGLILCREFIEKNNGKIWAQSLPEAGTTFSFLLPLRIENL